MPFENLVQYGVLGVLCAILLPFAYGAYKDQKNRADRLEEELREQNKLIQDKLVTELTRATEALATYRRSTHDR